WESFSKYTESLDVEKERLRSTRSGGKSYWERLRQQVPYRELPEPLELSDRLIQHIEIEAKYEGYIKRERELVKSMSQLEQWRIPIDFDYASMKGLKNESRAKLLTVKPETLAQASRIDGVTPAEISLLQVYIKRN
ncbi:MAG: tRNA uridine-5-carboxymethylaminomethyl(34) synthesis enzyme MnmG, partial [Lentisphaeria bacterium]|nr:tRNA uridine-5-carboxymethylaminomethyl(34) synthesis enzyme MnmG [Lentisphaeria bacterium]